MENERMMECFSCGETKCESMFVKHNRTKDGKRGQCKKCKSIADKKYRETHKESIAVSKKKYWDNNVNGIKEKNRRTIDLKRIGMTADKLENSVCEMCGLSNEESIEKYGVRLSVHHRNNDGRHNINNGLEPVHKDLQILCLSCHARVGNMLYRDYSNHSQSMKKAWETRRKRKAESIVKNKNSLQKIS